VSLGLAAALVAMVGASLLLPTFGLVQKKSWAHDGRAFYFHASDVPDATANQTDAPSTKAFPAFDTVTTASLNTPSVTLAGGSFAAPAAPKIVTALPSDGESLAATTTYSTAGQPPPLYLGRGTALARKDVATPPAR